MTLQQPTIFLVCSEHPLAFAAGVIGRQARRQFERREHRDRIERRLGVEHRGRAALVGARHLPREFGHAPWLCCGRQAAGAGAGLATAFNAPIAGAVFVLEELMRRFDTRTAIAALGASAAAIAVARALLGAAPDFTVEPLAYLGVKMWPLLVAFGGVAGLAGHLYNGTLLRTLAVMDRLNRWPIEVRAAAIGALVGALGFFVPTLIGGGDEITQRTLAGGAVLAVLPLAFVLRFGLGGFGCNYRRGAARGCG